MGYGNYSHDAHVALAQVRANLPQQQVFTQTHCHPLMDPKGVRARECRDSVDHPNSLAVVFALDVTGSMGEIPERLARQELPNFMKVLGDCQIQSPQLLFAAVGDAVCDRAALQVGQFEATAELMDQWLTWSYLEGGGGGQNKESYQLAAYFFAEHSLLDCLEKRDKRGYFIMTGDELPYPAVSRHEVETYVGDKLDDDIPTAEVFAALRRSYHPFFLIPDQQRRSRCESVWRDLLGDQVICMNAAEDTCYVAAGCIALTEKVVSDLDDFANRLRATGVNRDRIGSVVRALTPYADRLGSGGVPSPDEPRQPKNAPGLWKKIFGG
jgi:hypothetical protein